MGRGHGPARRPVDINQRPAAALLAPDQRHRLAGGRAGRGLTLAIFARGLRGPAVAVTVVDDAMVGWLAGLVGRGWWGLRGLACIGSWWVLYTMLYGLMLVLLVLRRWRHLIIWWVVGR